MKNDKENSVIAENLSVLLTGLLKLVFVLAVYGAVVQVCWNGAVTRIFPDLTSISYRDGIMLALLTNIFFKSSCNCKA